MSETATTESLLSVILATDNLERVETVLESIAVQTIASKIEVILVITTPPEQSAIENTRKSIHSLQVINVESIVPLAAARAIGVRAAHSPFLFIAETHAYPDPALAEKLI